MSVGQNELLYNMTKVIQHLFWFVWSLFSNMFIHRLLQNNTIQYSQYYKAHTSYYNVYYSILSTSSSHWHKIILILLNQITQYIIYLLFSIFKIVRKHARSWFIDMIFYNSNT